MNRFILCLALSLVNAWADFLYPSKGNVVELTPSNFNNLVIHGDDIWIVQFFAPWCIYSKKLVSEYTKAANELKGIVKFGAVNADEHKELGDQYGVIGYPTMKIFGANKNKTQDYEGARTAEAIVRACLQAKATAGGFSNQNRTKISPLTIYHFIVFVLVHSR